MPTLEIIRWEVPRSQWVHDAVLFRTFSLIVIHQTAADAHQEDRPTKSNQARMVQRLTQVDLV
jgi:hypothetical protein